MSQDEDKALDAAWRRASAEDAGRPSAKTRAAILAEAAAQARRRQPAANQPRYWMRMVAGVAVVGIGLVLWRQTDVRLPGEQPVVAVQMTQESAVTADAVAPVEQGFSQAPPAPPSAAPAPPVREDTARRRVEVAEERKAAGAVDLPSPPPEPAAVPVLPPPTQIQAPVTATAEAAGGGREAERDEGSELNEVQVTGTRVQRAQRPVGPRALPGATGGARREPVPAAADLLRLHFPEQHASAQPHRLWVVLDSGNRVVDTGELEAEQQLEALAPQIERDNGAAPGAWRIERIRNARDQSIELAISRLSQ
jgi:hypothetical protein